MSGKLRPEGRMLNHTITRPSNVRNTKIGGFNDRYIFPDGELQGPSTVVGAMHDHGFEVRHSENLREHYAMTLREWGRNLERHWDPAVGRGGRAQGARLAPLHGGLADRLRDQSRRDPPVPRGAHRRGRALGRSAAALVGRVAERRPDPRMQTLPAGARRRILR